MKIKPLMVILSHKFMELFIQSAQKLFKNYTVIKLNAYLIKFINTCLLRKKKNIT